MFRNTNIRNPFFRSKKSQDDFINKNGTLTLNNEKVELHDLRKKVSALNSELSIKHLQKFVTAFILYDENQLHLIDEVQSELHRVKIENINHLSKRTSKLLNRHLPEKGNYGGKTIAEARAIFYEQETNGIPLNETIEITLKKNNEIWVFGNKVALNNLVKTINKTLPNSQGNNYSCIIFSENIIQRDFLNALTREVKKIEPSVIKVFTEAHIESVNEHINKVDSSKVKVNNITTVNYSQSEVTPKQLAEYNTLAKKYNTMLSKNKSIQIKKKDVDRLAYIYELMSEKQRTDAEPFPDFPPLPPTPKAPKVPKVKKGEKSAIPQPPKPPKPPKQPKEMGTVQLNGNTYFYSNENGKTHYYDRFGRAVTSKGKLITPENLEKSLGETKNSTQSNQNITNDIQTIKEDIQRIKHINGEVESAIVDEKEIETYIERKIATQEIYDELSPNIKESIIQKQINEFNESATQSYTSIQAPPKPIAPIDYIIKMAKKDAEFYFEEKSITSDQAIEIVKKNKTITINCKEINDSKPKVYISI